MPESVALVTRGFIGEADGIGLDLAVGVDNDIEVGVALSVALVSRLILAYRDVVGVAPESAMVGRLVLACLDPPYPRFGYRVGQALGRQQEEEGAQRAPLRCSCRLVERAWILGTRVTRLCDGSTCSLCTSSLCTRCAHGRLAVQESKGVDCDIVSACRE